MAKFYLMKTVMEKSLLQHRKISVAGRFNPGISTKMWLLVRRSQKSKPVKMSCFALQVPRFLIESDEVIVSANLHNEFDSAQEFEVTLKTQMKLN